MSSTVALLLGLKINIFSKRSA